MRNGVKQLAKFGKPGIVALNIDDLIVLDGLTAALTPELAMKYLDVETTTFMRQQRSKLLRFLEDRRCDGILIVATGFATFASEVPDYDLPTMTTLWSKQTLDYRLFERLSCVRKLFSL